MKYSKDDFLKDLQTIEKIQLELKKELNALLDNSYRVLENESIENIIEILPVLATLRNTSFRLAKNTAKSINKIKMIGGENSDTQLTLGF